jgi:hypothetical protein
LSRNRDSHPAPANTMKLVCTGRHAHSTTVLAEVHLDHHGNVVLTGESLDRHRPRAGRGARPEGGNGTTWSLGPCSRCGHHPQLQHEHLVQLVRASHDQGLNPFDLSFFP